MVNRASVKRQAVAHVYLSCQLTVLKNVDMDIVEHRVGNLEQMSLWRTGMLRDGEVQPVGRGAVAERGNGLVDVLPGGRVVRVAQPGDIQAAVGVLKDLEVTAYIVEAGISLQLQRSGEQ